MKNILIVGAGFSGATIARVLAEAGNKIDVIDIRPHIGGNAYDEINKDGINVHKYGPHIFHTNNEEVVKFLSRFTDWIEYKHKVKASLEDGTYVTLPPNRETKEILDSRGLDVIETLFRPYTYKMWGKQLEELDPAIMNRVPIRDDDNELYFPNDKFQFMPKYGYTRLFENMLDHKNITISLNTPFTRDMEYKYDRVFNSMAIDEYYDYEHGELPYRSIKFVSTYHPYQDSDKQFPTPTVNFTTHPSATRITDWTKYPCESNNIFPTGWRQLTVEYPCDYKDNNNERFYPVKDIDGKNREIYEKYKSIKNDKVTFIGRCGLYAYLDMHQAVNSALHTAAKFISMEKQNES